MPLLKKSEQLSHNLSLRRPGISMVGSQEIWLFLQIVEDNFGKHTKRLHLCSAVNCKFGQQLHS